MNGMKIDTLGSTMCTAIEVTPFGVWLMVPFSNGESREIFLSLHMVAKISAGIELCKWQEDTRKEAV